MITMSRHLLLWLVAVVWAFQAPLTSAANALPEYTIKAGYLYNFAMLTEWPPNSAASHLELCYVGHEDLGAALESLQDKMVGNRRIDVRHIDDAAEVKECHVLFISEVDHGELPKIMREVTGRAVLTVTDDENVARAGVVIFLRPERQRLVFEINNSAAKNANMNISARLLRLARGGANE
jgi:hypothetical protein